jgi:chromosome segregation ATPase
MSITLDDFRTASEGEGVNVIPFYDLRRDATSIEDDKELLKRQAFSYTKSDIFEKQKNNLLGEIDNKKRELEDIKKQIKDFRAQNPSGQVSFSTFEKEVEDCQEVIDKVTGEIGDLKNDMKKAMDAWERFYNARAGVREYFDKVKDRLKEVRSDPAKFLGSSPSDDDLKNLLDYIGVIERKIGDEEKDHQDQEEGAKGTSEEFFKLIKITDFDLSTLLKEIDEKKREIEDIKK